MERVHITNEGSLAINLHWETVNFGPTNKWSSWSSLMVSHWGNQVEELFNKAVQLNIQPNVPTIAVYRLDKGELKLKDIDESFPFELSQRARNIGVNKYKQAWITTLNPFNLEVDQAELALSLINKEVNEQLEEYKRINQRRNSMLELVKVFISKHKHLTLIEPTKSYSGYPVGFLEPTGSISDMKVGFLVNEVVVSTIPLSEFIKKLNLANTLLGTGLID